MVLKAQQRSSQMGGAAAVCQMLRGLEVDVACAGVVGNDEAGIELQRLLDDCDVDRRAVFTDPSRPTTVKERFVGRAAGRHLNQILRVDNETSAPLADAVAAPLAAQLVARIAEFDMLLISDYAKGICTPELLAEIIAAARQANVPVLGRPAQRRRTRSLSRRDAFETEPRRDRGGNAN